MSVLFCRFFLFGCGAERCLRQIQRGEARAKQRETKRSAGFDYVLPMVKRKKRRKKEKLKKKYNYPCLSLFHS